MRSSESREVIIFESALIPVGSGIMNKSLNTSKLAMSYWMLTRGLLKISIAVFFNTVN